MSSIPTLWNPDRWNRSLATSRISALRAPGCRFGTVTFPLIDDVLGSWEPDGGRTGGGPRPARLGPDLQIDKASAVGRLRAPDAAVAAQHGAGGGERPHAESQPAEPALQAHPLPDGRLEDGLQQHGVGVRVGGAGGPGDVAVVVDRGEVAVGGRFHDEALYRERDGERREFGPGGHVCKAQPVHGEYRKTVSRSMPTTSPVCLV